MTTNNFKTKDKLLYKLIEINEKRKVIEDDFLKSIDFETIKKSKNNVIILDKDIINEGIIGIIASRMKEYFNMPAIILSKSNNEFKASARSTLDFNIGKFIGLLFDSDKGKTDETTNNEKDDEIMKMYLQDAISTVITNIAEFEFVNILEQKGISTAISSFARRPFSMAIPALR